jgi:hypothetical protein
MTRGKCFVMEVMGQKSCRVVVNEVSDRQIEEE